MAISRDVVMTDLNEDYNYDDDFDMIVTTIISMKKWERKDIVKM